MNCAESGLGFLAEVFEDDVADRCGDDRDGEVLDGEDVGEGDGESFAGAIGAVEFAHEEVGVEEEDDERDFDDRMADFGGEARFLGVFRHGDEGRNRGWSGAGRAAAFLCRDWSGYNFDFMSCGAGIWAESPAVCR